MRALLNYVRPNRELYIARKSGIYGARTVPELMRHLGYFKEQFKIPFPDYKNAIMFVREGDRLTKSGFYPGGINHQDAIQCKTGIAAQRGLPKETRCERRGKYASKAMTMAPVSNHREQSQVKGASVFDSGI
ncbi:hypothetical protein DSO57_1036052 [Entomophthora muscae]|uniref:Uncharacterized protein n=1 Tax=Entomophthora muscae TaxID=34485 RepID=A0ACC2SZD4_9FUNG|nr:hypothetical protein DSO57_1036052 [Entomophthora muscae]